MYEALNEDIGWYGVFDDSQINAESQFHIVPLNESERPYYV